MKFSMTRQKKVGLLIQVTAWAGLTICSTEVQFIWNVLWKNKKRWPLNTGDCLIEVTACAGLTVSITGLAGK
jgi:hypothetical protein